MSTTAASRRAGAAPPPRAKAGARARRRRRLLIVVAAVVVLLAIAYGLSVSPLLAVDELQVQGAQRLTTAQVEDAGGVHQGDAMAWIDTTDATAAIEALPYVRSATLTREWPDTVRITVRERRPVAWAEGPSGIVLVDGTGRVLEVVDAAPPATPQLVGAKVVPPPGGRVDATAGARVAGALTGLAAVGTSSVDVTDQGIVVHLLAGPEIRLGPPTQIAVKLRAAFAVLDAVAGEPVTYVDVSVPTNPVVG